MFTSRYFLNLDIIICMASLFFCASICMASCLNESLTEWLLIGLALTLAELNHQLYYLILVQLVVLVNYISLFFLVLPPGDISLFLTNSRLSLILSHAVHWFLFFHSDLNRLYWMTKRAAERQGSGLMKANAWHHRTDAISSVVALIGVGKKHCCFWWYLVGSK